MIQRGGFLLCLPAVIISQTIVSGYLLESVAKRPSRLCMGVYSLALGVYRAGEPPDTWNEVGVYCSVSIAASFAAG